MVQLKFRQDKSFRALCVFVSAALFGFWIAGCTSDSTAKSATATTAAEAASPAAAQSSTGPDLDLNCVIANIQDPKDAFHYSFKDRSSNPWEEDADVSPDSISGSFVTPSLPQPQHFQGPPKEAWGNLRAIARMASIFALVRNTSAMVRNGPEQVNGYDAVKFSIDTTAATPIEQGLYNATLGPQGFEKGTVWVRADGCPVKMVIDEELHFKDGRPPQKAHYEEAMVKN